MIFNPQIETRNRSAMNISPRTLLIRPHQLKTFRQNRFQQFEAEMLIHIREHFPEHARILPEARLLEIVRFAHSRAGGYGLDTVRSVCIYLNCMLWMGSLFDTDTQYPWARAILLDSDVLSQHDRASRLSNASTQYMLELCGPENSHLVAVIRHLLQNIPAQPSEFIPAGINPATFLAGIFPKKWELLPDEISSGGLFAAARRFAARYGLQDDRGILLYALLMFLLGSGFDTDPQFPWASTILKDPEFSAEQKINALLRSGKEQLLLAWQ